MSVSTLQIAQHNYQKAQLKVENTWDNLWASISDPQPDNKKKISRELELLQQALANAERSHQNIIERPKQTPWYLGKTFSFILLGTSLLTVIVSAIVNSVDAKVQNNPDMNCVRPTWLLVVLWVLSGIVSLLTVVQGFQAYFKNQNKKAYKQHLELEKKNQGHIKEVNQLLVKFIGCTPDKKELQDLYIKGIVAELKQLPSNYSDHHPEIHDILLYLINLTPEGSDSRLLISSLKNAYHRKRSTSLPALPPTGPSPDVIDENAKEKDKDPKQKARIEPIAPPHFLKTSGTDKASRFRFESFEALEGNSEAEKIWQELSEKFGVDLALLRINGEAFVRKRPPLLGNKKSPRDELAIEIKST